MKKFIDHIMPFWNSQPTLPSIDFLKFFARNNGLFSVDSSNRQRLLFSDKNYRESKPYATRTSNTALTIASEYEAISDDQQALLRAPTTPLVVSLNTVGAAGRDFATGIENNRMYYLWMCQGSSGTTVIISRSKTSPSLPSGYTDYKRYLGAWSFTTSGSFGWIDQRIFQHGPLSRVVYSNKMLDYFNVQDENLTNVIDSQQSSFFTTVSLEDFVPTDVRDIELQVGHFSFEDESTEFLYIRDPSSGETFEFIGALIIGENGALNTYNIEIQCSPTRTIQYQTPGNDSFVDISIRGYYEYPS